MNQYMVEFLLPAEMTEEFIAKIPMQRSKVNQMMQAGKLMTYSLAADRSKLWAVFKAENEYEVMKMIAEFPLKDHMEHTIVELMFHNTVTALKFPLYSLN